MSSLFTKIGSMLNATEQVSGNAVNLPAWVNTLVNAVQYVLNPILIVACLVGIVYAIWVGITFAKADSSDQRKEAKQKLITVIVGVVAALALIVLFYWLMWMIKNGKLSFWKNDWGNK